ncbi:MAG: hypothetical protein IKU53_00295, partial [Firmicutes bacterium]|nr:hypothetical protein [Bacillota bacterium]
MKRRIITILFVLVIGLIACTSFASADSTIDYQVYGTQDYAAAQEVLAQLNSLRAQNGLHALTLDPTLTSIAMQRAAECSVKYSHTRPDESNFDSIIRSYSKFTFGYCGENIAAGYRNPTAVMTGWINSQGHYDNMVSPTYYSVGIGCFYQDDGTKYWAQVFHSAKSSSYETNSSPITKNNISIHSATSNCSLYLDGYGDCAVNLYKGMSTQPRLYVKNVGYSYGSAIYLSGGYSLRSQNTAVATTSGYKVTGISPGSTYIDFVFNSGYIPIPYNILATPTLSYSNSNGNIILTLDGYLDNTTNNVSVYYKESNEDVWTLTNINNSNHNYTITNAEYGDTFTCVMRYYDDHLGTWVQVGDSITVKKRLSTPKVNVITLASTGKPKVTWNAVDGADKYEVWRKVGADGTYKKMYVTTKTSYTNKTAIAGTKYYYRVRAIYENNSAGNSLY